MCVCVGCHDAAQVLRGGGEQQRTWSRHKESGKEEEMQRGDGGERGGDAAEYMQELLCKEYITDMTLDVFRSGFFCQVAGNNVTQFFAAAPSSTLLLVVQVVQSVSRGTITWHHQVAASLCSSSAQFITFQRVHRVQVSRLQSTVYSLEVKSCVPV